jgi:hypothetical protein
LAVGFSVGGFGIIGLLGEQILIFCRHGRRSWIAKVGNLALP